MNNIKVVLQKKYWNLHVRYIIWRAHNNISLPKADTSGIPDLSEISDEEIEQMLSA